MGVIKKGYALFGIMLSIVGCSNNKEQSVVIYTALDRNFSEPIFEAFSRDTGIKVLPKYDTESTKTVGLVNTIIAEAENPRCDVFWNNEIVNTIRLKKKGLLESSSPMNAELYPKTFKDQDGQWYGFAARARVLIVNTNLVKKSQMPTSIYDLGSKKFKGRVGLAKPLFGTTASHAACLFSELGDEEAKAFFRRCRQNRVVVESGNKTCAVNVSAGKRAFAMTDTDDAIIEIRAGNPVAIVFPDARADQMGTLMIPNTVARIRGGPNPEAAEVLINYLLSPEIEKTLSEGESAQIPLNSTYKDKHPLGKLPDNLQVVDFNAAADSFDRAAAWIHNEFLVE